MTRSGEGMPSFFEAAQYQGKKQAEREHTDMLMRRSAERAERADEWVRKTWPAAVSNGRGCPILRSAAVLLRGTTTSNTELKQKVRAWALEGHGCTANVQTCPNCNQANTTREAA